MGVHVGFCLQLVSCKSVLEIKSLKQKEAVGKWSSGVFLLF